MSHETNTTRRTVLRSIGALGIVGIAGCSGDGGGDETDTPTENPAGTTSMGTDTPTGTPTATPTNTPTPTPEMRETVRAAWIYNAEVGDRGWSWTHDQARQTLDNDLDWLETSFTSGVAPGDAEAEINAYADDGYHIVFGTTADYEEALNAASSSYPDTAFEHCQGFSTGTNKGRYFGRMDQARYLTGVAAGIVTEEDTIGYVAPYSYSEIVRGINAFALGARSVNEDATTIVEWSNAWYDQTAESAAAQTLLDEGVDVMAQHQDSTAVLETAANDGIWASGYQSPMGDVAGDNYLTSPLWNWEAFYEPTLQNVRNVQWEPDFYYGGIGDGIVDVDDWGPQVPQNAKDEVAATRTEISNGNLDIWAGSMFSDWSASERYGQMGSDADGAYVDGVEGSLEGSLPE